ncbi:unnamed protein product [Peniophora sp. CBMAI 1063]|nr:unnamed protein product [Peniophora sp. CBMAI 1063]
MALNAQEQNYRKAKKRVVEAASAVLGPAANLAHEALFVGVDLLQFVPVPALDVAGKMLLSIWDAVELIEVNRLSCLRLTERSAELLLAIREEIGASGTGVAEELKEPVARLHIALEEIHDSLQKQIRRPFWLRYVKREDTQRDILYCDTLLDDALGLFSFRIQIRTLRLVQESEARFSQIGAVQLVSDVAPSSAHALPVPPDADDIQDATQVRRSLSLYRQSQNISDLALDMINLRQLLHIALQEADDGTLMKFLQIGPREMTEAIEALQRVLEEGGTILERATTPLGDEPRQDADRSPIRDDVAVLRRLSNISGISAPTVHAQDKPVPITREVKRQSLFDKQKRSMDRRGLKVSMNDPVYLVLPSTMHKYNVSGNWQDYVMMISYGPQDDRTECCLSYDQKPLVLYQKLKDDSQDPFLTLVHVVRLPSPCVIARKALYSSQSHEGGAATHTAQDTLPTPTSITSHVVLRMYEPGSTLHLDEPTTTLSSGDNTHEDATVYDSTGHGGGYVGYCVAIYSYTAKQEGNLDVTPGDTFTILSRAKDRWLLRRDRLETDTIATDPPERGWAPEGCLLETRIPVARAIAHTASYTSLSAGLAPSSSKKTMNLERAGNVDPWLPIHPQHIVSESFLEHVLMDYTQKDDEELSVSEGDLLRVYKRFKHWSYAVKEDNGERGWVPTWQTSKVEFSS